MVVRTNFFFSARVSGSTESCSDSMVITIRKVIFSRSCVRRIALTELEMVSSVGRLVDSSVIMEGMGVGGGVGWWDVGWRGCSRGG